MTERQGNSDRYERMSPQELNVELRQVYAQIPKYEESHCEIDISGAHIFYYREEKGSERFRRKESSEHKKRLVDMHAELISRSHTTSFLQNMMNHRFSSEYDNGYSIDRWRSAEVSAKPQFRSLNILVFTDMDLLDLDNQGSAGIYDPERAKEIERKLYRAKLSQDTFLLEQSAPQGSQILADLTKEAPMRGEWMNQFLRKHGELP